MTGIAVAQETIMPTDIDDIKKALDAILHRLMGVEAQVVALKTLQENEAKLCPYRNIVETNTVRLNRLEEMVANLRIEMAKQSILSGTAGGGIVGIVGGALLLVGKALKWW